MLERIVHVGGGWQPSLRRAGVRVRRRPRRLRRVMRAHLGDFRDCYTQELRRDAEGAGKVLLVFDIVANGSVAHASIAATTTHSAALDQCVVAVVAALSFPQPPGTLTVRYPFVFKTARP